MSWRIWKASMTTAKIKAEALAWLRFVKMMPIVCTEVGTWNADVFGCSPTTSIEVEVKVSRSDLLAEFRNKKAKHSVYSNANGTLRSVPNYLYYMVPKELEEDALEIVGRESPKSGVIVFDDSDGHLAGKNSKIVKSATKLHGTKPSQKLVRTAVLRMSSELSGLWHANNRLIDYTCEELRKMSKAAVTASYRNAGALDTEDPETGLEVRAAELALAVDDLAWVDLDDTQKQKWRTGAAKLLDITEPSVERWVNEAYNF